MVAVGTAPDDWDLYRDLARAHPDAVRYTVGIHPCSVDAGWERAVAQMDAFWAGDTPPAASTLLFVAGLADPAWMFEIEAEAVA